MRDLPKSKGKPKDALTESLSRAKLERQSLEAKAAAAAELARRPHIDPKAIVYAQPTGQTSADGSPGAVKCECRRAHMTCGNRVLTFDRDAEETLEAFEARVLAAKPRDGRSWAIVFDPIIREKEFPYRLPVFECNPFPDYKPSAFIRAHGQRFNDKGERVPWDPE